MANDEMKEMLQGLLQDLDAQRADMATLQQRMASVIGSATSSADLVTAWVNTRGILIQLKFHPEAVERAGGLESLGRYITEATQAAAQQAKAKVDEIMAPMKARMDKMPQLSEMFPGLPDSSDYFPEPVEPSTEPPDSQARSTNVSPNGDEYYEDVEERPQSRQGLYGAW